MTPEAQRRAIGEACGWKRDGEWEGFPRWKTPNGERFGTKNDPLRCVPDYLSDLNAMHEAEKVLTEDQYEHFQTLLLVTTPNQRRSSYTASQRAEAFLRALNLWDDNK